MPPSTPGLYATGRGVPQDLAEAVRWYRRAVLYGYVTAQHILGLMYQTARTSIRMHAGAARAPHAARRRAKRHPMVACDVCGYQAGGVSTSSDYLVG